MISPFVNYIEAIKSDVNFWEQEAKSVLSSGKINSIWNERLSLEPIRTRSHIHNVVQILSGANVQLETDALTQARRLKEELHSTAYSLRELIKQENHSPVLDLALTHITEAIQENDELIHAIGIRKHTREYPAAPVALGISGRISQLMRFTGSLASAYLAKSSEMVIPPSPHRPYRTECFSAPEAEQVIRELLLGIRNDIQQFPLGEEGVRILFVPGQFGIDVTRGNYSLQGNPVYTRGESVTRAVEAYQAYCHVLGNDDRAFAIATMLCQSFFARDVEVAQERLAPPLLASGGNTFFDVSLENQRVKIAFKIVLEAISGIDLGRHHALLMKTVLTLPLHELDNAVTMQETLRKGLQGDPQADAKLKVALEELVKRKAILPSLSAVDYISSPIATVELGEEYISQF